MAVKFEEPIVVQFRDRSEPFVFETTEDLAAWAQRETKAWDEFESLVV